jgi:hypothetical protein
VLGIVTRYQPSGVFDTFLTRLDPRTLRPVGRRADVQEFHPTWSFSPEGGRQVAVGTGGQGLGVHVYDVSRMRLARAVRTGVAAEGLAWLEPRRLVALLQAGGIAVIDPRTGQVVRRQPLRSGERACFAESRASIATRRGLVTLLSGRSARLLLVDAEGEVRALELPSAAAWGCDRAGVAVDAGGDRAVVLARDGRLADVDLSTMRATFHTLAGDPLRPATHRRLLWLAEDRLVAAGLAAGGRPTGVSLVDAAAWTNRMLDPAARAVVVAGGRALTHDGRQVDLGGGGHGVAAFDSGGRRVFRALAGEQVDVVHVVAGRVFAQDLATVRALDPASGEVTAEVRARRTEIVVLDRAGG